MSSDDAIPKNFIHQAISSEVQSGKYPRGITTRFPPEPNGYLHIGHAKSICLNFGLALEFNGKCFMRFDDTNPDKENHEFVEAIKYDVNWLGFDWHDSLSHSSNYFDQLYDFARELINNKKAFVCDLSLSDIRSTRGTLTSPGENSPFRDRTIEENLELFEKMRKGEFSDGDRVLRAKIDMSSPNIHLRDPVIYRIKHSYHHNTKDKWCIYPLYDFTHPLSDALENVSHSLCTLEFEDNRALYDWILENVTITSRPRQIEFSRLSLEYTVVSKRLLTMLVDSGIVNGWNDPRMPTLSGMRRRGYPPDAIVEFCKRIGVTRNQQHIELTVLENCVRESLDKCVNRVFAVLDPIKLIIENYPNDEEEQLEAANHPADPEMGTREVSFCKELYIDRNDFLENPPRKFFRLSPGKEVRLRYAYLVTCTDFSKDDQGNVTEIRCTYDPSSKGGNAIDGRKVKGTIHWVSARHSRNAEVRLYQPLFTNPEPKFSTLDDLKTILNENSLNTIANVKIEPGLSEAQQGDTFQFERHGYFCVDTDSSKEKIIFNRTVALRDSWNKAKKD